MFGSFTIVCRRKEIMQENTKSRRVTDRKTAITSAIVSNHNTPNRAFTKFTEVIEHVC